MMWRICGILWILCVGMLCGGTLESSRTFLVDYRHGKSDAEFAAGNAHGVVVNGAKPTFTDKGLEVGAGRASLRYQTDRNLPSGQGTVEILFENSSYDWNGREKNMLLQCAGKELTFYIYKHSNDGLGAFFSNVNPRWTAFPRQTPARMGGRGMTHLVVSYSADGLQVFVNGRLARSMKLPSATGPFGEYFSIGPSGRFARDGISTIARVVAYGRPLSADEAMELFRNASEQNLSVASSVAPASPDDFLSRFGRGKESYKLLLFSDWHFDRMAFHSPDPARMWVMEQAKRYSGLWEKFSLDVLDAANSHEGDFVLSCGDSLEGYFNSPESQSQALRELDALVAEHLRRPWFPVPGNHEYAPADNRDAFFSTAAELKLMPAGVRSYSVRYGRDLYIFWDNISARIDFIRKALESHPDARHVFVVCHLPVLPVAGRTPRWIAFGSESADASRRELLELLCRRNAIVLCGHVHFFSHGQYQGKAGQFTQFTVNSTIDDFAWVHPSVSRTDPDYSFILPVDYRRVKDEAAMRLFLNEYQGRISNAEFVHAAGYGQLRIEEKNVFVDLYCGSEEEAFARWKLR